MTGIIFDVDGTITTVYGVESPIDRRIVEKTCELYNRGHKIAFVTGRAKWYMEENLLPLLREFDLYDKVLVVGERGAYRIKNGKVFVDSNLEREFSPYRQLIKEEVFKVAEKRGIPVKKEELREPPKTGELWIEDKKITLDVRPNQYNERGLVTEDSVYEVTVEAVRRLCRQHDLSSLEILKTSLSAVVLFKKLTKYNMAKAVVETLDPQNLVERWYVFGDSEDDRQMAGVYPEKMTFVDVRGRASKGTLEKLEEIFQSS